MNAKDLLLQTLVDHAKTYRKKVKRCRDDFSTDAIHDLRTSIRRLLAILDVIAFMTSASRIEKISDDLKDQLDGSSDLRDMQVMLDRLSEDIVALPELEPLQDYLQKQEKRRQQADKEQIDKIKLSSTKQRLQKVQEAVEERAEADVERKLPQAVDVAYLTVIQRYSEMDPAELATIHKVRVAFKKFRYMVEAVHPCLPNFSEALLTSMREYQTKMGNIHDCQVFLQTLAEFADQSDLYDPAPLRQFYEHELERALSTYLESKDDVICFWRATPLEAFPWEAGSTPKEV